MSDDLSQKRELLPTRIESMPADMKRGWSVIVERPDGSLDELSEVARVTITNPKFGALNYGKSPSGNYDQWAFHEVGGGGSVVVPYAIYDGELVVGMIVEKRPFQAELPVLNVPRGFVDPNEKHLEAAKREVREEAGLESERMHLLPGKPANPNSTFFETWGEIAEGKREGVYFYGLELPSSYISWPDQGGPYVLNSDLVKPAAKGIAEKVSKCEFHRIYEAIGQGDSFTDVAIARLLGFLNRQKR